MIRSKRAAVKAQHPQVIHISDLIAFREHTKNVHSTIQSWTKHLRDPAVFISLKNDCVKDLKQEGFSTEAQVNCHLTDFNKEFN